MILQVLACESCIRARLVTLFLRMSRLTRPECEACVYQYQCCRPSHCRSMARYARRVWGVELKETGHSELPFMGPTGCTVAPHLRPLCTIHTCAMQSAGFKRGDPMWTRKYYELSAEIDAAVSQLHEVTGIPIFEEVMVA